MKIFWCHVFIRPNIFFLLFCFESTLYGSDNIKGTDFHSLVTICDVNRVRSMSIFFKSPKQLMRNECRNVVNKLQYRFTNNNLIFKHKHMHIKSNWTSSCLHYYIVKSKHCYESIVKLCIEFSMASNCHLGCGQLQVFWTKQFIFYFNLLP